MKILYDLPLCELEREIVNRGYPKYRAAQIYLGQVRGKAISEISEIPAKLKQELLEEYCDAPVKILKKLTSKDGTVKYVLGLHDGNVVEGVLMSYKYGKTQCVSTQVGCRMGCKFCASTLGGLVRNLTVGELLFTVALVNRDASEAENCQNTAENCLKTVQNGNEAAQNQKQKQCGKSRGVTNVVLMGSGEPLDNYDNVVAFLKELASSNNLNVSPRNVSLSTCGLVDKMYKLADENLPLNLTVSLHSAFDEKRKKIMPVANAYSICEIIKACKNYFSVTKRRYIFEYSLVRGVNDGAEDAAELIRILKGLPCHVNLIRLNEVKETGLKKTADARAYDFCETLKKGGLSATVRRLMGSDIEGACGQLRAKYVAAENK